MPRLVFALLVFVGTSLPVWSADSAVKPTAEAKKNADLPKGARLRIGTARFRHGAIVRGVAFSPDGKLLASASHDHTVSIWEAPSGRERYRFRGHGDDVLCVAFSNDGRLVASGGADGVLRLWSLHGDTAGQEVHAFASKAEAVEALSFAPGGKVLAAGGDDGVVRIYDVARHTLVRQLSQDRGIRCLAWSPDGKAIVTNGENKAVTLWDADKGTRLRTFGNEAIQCIAFAPTGKQAVSWEAGGVLRLWNMEKGTQIRSWGGGEVNGGSALIYQIAWSGDGKSVLCGSTTGPINVWDPATGKRQKQFLGHVGRVPALAVRQGSLVATGGADGTIRLWDMSTDKEITSVVEPAAPIVSLSLASKGEQLAVVLGSGQVQVWNRVSGKQESARFKGRAAKAVFGPDGRVYLIDEKGGVVRWNVKTGEAVSKKDAFPGATGLALSADGKHMVTTQQDGGLVLRDGKGVPRRACQGKEQRVTAVMSPDGERVVAVGQQAAILMWNGKTGKPETSLAGHRGGSLTAGFAPDGKTLATGGRDRMVRIWDLQTHKEKGSGFGHTAWVCATAYSPDGKLLATGTIEGDVQVWGMRSGRLLLDLEGHRGSVSGLAFADAKTLVSAGRDTSVLVWDVARAADERVSLMPLSPAGRDRFWGFLAQNDPATVLVAIQRLARDSSNAVEYLRPRVKAVDGKQMTQLLEDLDSAEFKTRTAALKNLADLGRFAEGSLRKELTKRPNLEKRRRIDELLAKMADEKLTAEHLRALRAVEVLRIVGTEEARKLLETLAGGAVDADLTRKAKAALEGLKKP